MVEFLSAALVVNATLINIIKKQIMQHYRHGDVSLHPKKEMPKNLEEKEFNGKFILAKGKATGHHHNLIAKDSKVKIFKDDEGQHWLKLEEEAKLTHPEHDTITIEPGIYEQKMEREYDPFQEEIRKVMD